MKRDRFYHRIATPTRDLQTLFLQRLRTLHISLIPDMARKGGESDSD
jgi:hypothetical protein